VEETFPSPEVKVPDAEVSTAATLYGFPQRREKALFYIVKYPWHFIKNNAPAYRRNQDKKFL